MEFFSMALDILSQLGVLPAVQLIAVSAAAIYIYKYFMNQS